MVTVCRTCSTALDEDVESCPGCGSPNPWFRDPADGGWFQYTRLLDFNTIFLEHPERPLLAFGVLCLIFGGGVAFGELSVVTWSQLPGWSRVKFGGMLALVVTDFGLGLYADLQRPTWRVLARVLIALQIAGLMLLVAWDRTR